MKNMKRALFLILVVSFVLGFAKVKGQNYDTTWVHNNNITFNYAGSEPKSESMFWVMPRLNNSYLPYSNHTCVGFYVALESMKTDTTFAFDGIDMTTNPITIKTKATITQNTIALGTINADGTSASSSPVYTKFIDFGASGMGLSVEFRDFDFGSSSADNVAATYNLHIIMTYTCGGDNQVSDVTYPAGTWNYTDKYADFRGEMLSIQVPDIAANICEGSISDIKTVATVSNADAGGSYTITLADGGGASTFNPSYATVSGDTIKIAPNCPAGNYTVKATVTDAASNTAETTFAFTVNAKPDISISATPGTTICKNDALTLSITDAKSVANQYAWDAVGTSTDANIPSHNTFSASNATYSAAPTATMTYQAIAKSAAGCLDTAELAITVNEAPLATLTSSDAEVCSGETITLTVTEVAGSTITADSWEWVNPAVATTTNTVTVTPTNTGNTQIQIEYKVKSVKGTCKSAEFNTMVKVNPQPNLSVTNQPIAQCEGTQVDLSSATLGGASGLTLSYYSDANCTTTVTNTLQTVALADSPKSFWVVGKNPTTGCSDTVELKATVKPNPAKPTITAPTDVCEGSTATLTVAGVTGATYKWYNAGGTQVGTGTSYTTPALTAAASYTVEVEVAGCTTMSDAHNIGINQKPTVTIPTIADACAGTEVDLQATLSGGTTPYSHYVWNITAAHGGAALVVQSDSTQVKATLGKGLNTLTLTVTDAKGCTGTGSQTGNGGYIQGPALSANPNPFLAGTSTSLTLTAAGSSAGNAGAITDYDYSRLSPVPAHLGNTTAATYNPTVLPTAQTNYRVVMTTAKGCKDSADVTVNYTARELEWVHLQGDTVCLADLSGGAVLQAKAHFGTQPYTYTWNVPAGAGVQTQSVQGDSLVLTFDAAYATPGTYTVGVTLTDSDPGGSKSISQNVTLIIGATPDVKINGDASADLATCLNETLNLTASTTLAEGVSYLWKEPSTLTSPTNATQPVATTTVNTTGTTYKVVATSVYGCVDSAARKVIVNDLPTITLTANHDTVCPGDYVTVEVTSGGDRTEYTWIGGATGEGKSKTVPISVATKFEVKRTDANGCVATADTTIQVYEPEVLVLSGDTTVCNTPQVTLTLTASGLTGSGYYSWSSTTGDVTGNATSKTVTPTVTTTYYVDGSDVHGCMTARDSIVVKVDKMPTLTVSEHTLAACDSVDLSGALSLNGGSGVIKYGTTANFTGGTVITASSSKVGASGKYYVRAENGVCKSDEDTVRVNVLNQPKLELFAGALEACEPDSVNLADKVDWTGTTYDRVNLTYWDGDPAISGSQQLTSTKVYPGVGSKDYWIQGASDGCPSQTKKVTVTIHPKPVLAITGDTAVCTPTVDLSAAVGATGSVSVTKNYFSDAACTTSVGATVNTSGTYYVVGETAEGCLDTIGVTVRIKPHPAVNLTLSSDEVCKDETVQLTVNGGATGDTYSWKVNGASVTETTNTYTTDPLTSNTTVGVTVTNAEECTTDLDTTITIYTPEAISVTPATASVCAGDSITLTVSGLTTAGGAAAAGTAYEWSGGSLAAGTTGLSVKVAHDYNPGGTNTYTYTVTGKDVHGCEATAGTATITVNEVPAIITLNDTLKSCSDVALTTANTNLGLTYTPTDATVAFAADRNFASATTNAAATGIYYVKATKGSCSSAIDSIWVEVTGSLTLEVEDTLVVCDAAGTRNLKDAITNAVNLIDTTFWRTKTGNVLSGQMTDAEVAAAGTGTYYVKGNGGDCDVERTVKVVNMKPVITVTDPSAVCANDSIDLAAAVTQTAGMTYRYYNGTTSLTAVGGNVWVKTAGTYRVIGENRSGCRDTQDIVVPPFNELPVVTLAADGDCEGEVVTITATLTSGTASSYTWTGATPSAAPNGHQATLRLTSAGQTVGVEVETPDHCIAQIDSVFTGRVCNVLVVQVPDTTICSTEDNVKLTAHSSGGTVTSWAWRQIRPATVTSLTYTDSVLTLPSMTAGTYEFEVSVNGGAAKDTAHVTVEQGVEITSLVALDSCSSTVELEVVATNATTYTWSLVEGHGTCYPMNDKSKLALDGGETAYKVAVEVSNGGLCKASDTLSGHVYTGLTIAFRGDDTCGRDIQLPLQYQVNGVYGNIVAKYTYQPVGGTAVKDSVRITPPTSGFITAAQPGTYVLTEVYGTNAKGCVVTVNDTVKVGALPEAELAENCLALHKDSIFNLNIANTGDFNYIWGVSHSSDRGATWTAGAPGDGTTTNTIQGTMEDEDLQYIITATDPNVAKCKASDTAYIYRIPDAPIAEIDTFEDKRHIQLKWTTAAYADNYTVWSRKWDPYCLTGRDGNVYAAEDTTTALSWPEPQMDSLEFYYLTANREICGTEYHSVATDTFGYARHIIDGTIVMDPAAAAPNRAAFAFQYAFPYIFDMSRYGIKNVIDFAQYITDNRINIPIKAIGAWEKDNLLAAGLWGWEANNYTVFGTMGIWFPRGTANDTADMVVGSCHMIDVEADSVLEFVISGKLNDAAHAEFIVKNTGSVGSNAHNPAYLPFKRINETAFSDIAPEVSGSIIDNLNAMGFWTFDIDGWNTDNVMPAMAPIIPNPQFITTMSGSTSTSTGKAIPRIRAGYDVISFDAGIATGNVYFIWK